MDSMVRRATQEDCQMIEQFIEATSSLSALEARFGKFSVSKLIEFSIFSVVTFDQENYLTGFACFSDAPPVLDVDHGSNLNARNWHTWFKNTYSDLDNLGENNMLWMTFLSVDPAFELNVSENLLRTVFSTLAWVETVALLLSPTTPSYCPVNDLFEPIKAVGGSKIAAKTDVKSSVFLCFRSVFVPTLSIRVAKVEDHDDLAPVFNQQAAILSQIYGDFFLSELIQSQNEDNIALVADADHQKAVGLISLTTDLDITILQSCFDLTPFENLQKVESDQSGNQKYKPGDINAFCITLFCVDAAFESRAIDFLSASFKEFPDLDYCLLTLPHVIQYSQLLEHFTLALPQPNNTFSHVLYVCHRDSLGAVLRVRMTEKSDLDSITSFVSNLDNSTELCRAIYFSLKVPSSNSYEFDESEAIEMFANAFPSESKIEKGAIDRDLDSMIIEASGQIVGVAICGSGVELDFIKSHFVVEDYLSNANMNENCGYLKYFILNPLFVRHTRILIKEIVRIYSRENLFYRHFLNEPLQPVIEELVQVDARPNLSWNYELLSMREQKLNKSKSDFQELIAKKDLNLFSLFLMNKRLISQTKQVINTRIVIIGASDACYGFLESLFTVPYLHFSNVVLISRNGMFTRPTEQNVQSFFPESSSFDNDMLTKLCLHNKVRYLEDVVVDVDKERKLIYISDGTFVPYDILVITAGLQVQDFPAYDASGQYVLGTGTNYSLPTTKEDKISSITSIADNSESSKRLGSLVQSFFSVLSEVDQVTDAVDNNEHVHIPGVITLNSVNAISEFFNILTNIPISAAGPYVIYGNTATAVTCIRGLLLQGAIGSSITWITPDNATSCSFIPNQTIADKLYSFLDSSGIHRLHGVKVVHVDVKDGFAASVCLCKTDSAQPLQEEPARPASLVELENGFYRLPCGIFFNADSPTIDPYLFKIIEKCNLVFDGRIVVDSSFRTSDPYIFAAGSVAKFSRVHGVGNQMNMDQYNSKECGEKLATSIRQVMSNLSDFIPFGGETPALPIFRSPKVLSAVFPNEMYYLSCISNGSPPYEIGKRIGVDHVRGFCGFIFDTHTILQRFFYFGPNRISASSFSYLVGLSSSYFNNIIQLYEEGNLTDVLLHFEGGWSSPLFHDGFRRICDSVRSSLLSSSEIIDKVESLKDQDLAELEENLTNLTNENKSSYWESLIKERSKLPTLLFLYENATHLPGFSWNDSLLN